jgi:predicted transcriptional regulator
MSMPLFGICFGGHDNRWILKSRENLWIQFDKNRQAGHSQIVSSRSIAVEIPQKIKFFCTTTEVPDMMNRIMGSETLGELQLEVWRHIADQDGATVAEVAREFAKRRGLAKTTILTVMERLRKKEYLSRKRDGNVWRYFTRKQKAQFLRSLVGRFMDQSLGGSLDPFIAYLLHDAELTEDQSLALKQFVEQMEPKKKGGGKP